MARHATGDQGADGRHLRRGPPQDLRGQRDPRVQPGLKRRRRIYPIELRTERLVLRELTVADAPLVLKYSGQPEPMFFGTGLYPDLPSVEGWLRASARAAAGQVRLRHQLGVELEGVLIGSARCDIEASYDLQGSVGYALWNDFWGRGFGTEAAAAMLAFGFSHLGLHRIEATIEPGNARSIRVAEKLGMRVEGRLRERFRAPDGWKDSILYAILAEEWGAETR